MTKQEAISKFEENVPNRFPVKVAQADTDWYIYSENMLDKGKPLKGVIDACFYKVSESGVEFISMMKLSEGLAFKRI